MVQLFANSGDLDQMPHSAASDLGLHCLPVTPLVVSYTYCKEIIPSILFVSEIRTLGV